MNLRPRKKIKFTTTEKPLICVNRISQLPDDIIHRILSFLTTEAIIALRTLSKRWSSIGAAYTSFAEPPLPKQTFLSCRQRLQCLQEHHDKFMNFVNCSLQRVVASKIYLQRFALTVNLVDLRYASRIDDCIELVSKRCVNELDLHIKSKRGTPYTVPRKIYEAKTLSILRLRHCKLEPPADGESIKFTSLKQLCLTQVKLEDGIVQSIISSCSMIEQLKLVTCPGVGCLRLSDLPYLNKVKISQCSKLPIPILTVDAPNVRELIYHESTQPCKFDISACTRLTRLSLRYASSIDDLYRSPLSLYSDLEILDLQGRCLLLKRVNICGHQLKKLTSSDLHTESIIDVPNLCCFRYLCYEDSMSGIFAIRTSGLKTRLLMLDIFVRKMMTTLWFLKFRESIEHLRSNNKLNLKLKLYPFVASFNLRELEHMSIPPVQRLKYVEVQLKEITYVTSRRCFDGLLWSCRPDTLAIVTRWRDNLALLYYLFESMKETEGKLNCCTDLRTSKCWRHFLKGYQIKISGKGKCSFEDGFAIMELVQNLAPYTKIVFQLKW
ncbi:hypothetical protein K2173_024490 [Erythroxylum novogranatense]|uniref:F-box domain-containing protein n=1 Tax=Erythroxylum novogranatense TaxID=1862640 RepID=A0AAV8SV86_9ROSI|nr:hypothetical protein K2173_024490 [Erythroxylum novogranatense]